MGTILSVDLAAKLSAVVQRGPSGEVLAQFDSRDKPALTFCAEVARIASESDLTVVEDVPYGVSSQAMVKPVLRLQGALIGYLIALKAAERTVFMSPSVWMKEFPGTMHAPRGLNKSAADKYRIEQAAEHARVAGYEPPDLVAAYVDSLPEGTRILKKNTNVLEKNMTDYISAFLMSEFSMPYSYDQLIDMKGVSPVSL